MNFFGGEIEKLQKITVAEIDWHGPGFKLFVPLIIESPLKKGVLQKNIKLMITYINDAMENVLLKIGCTPVCEVK